MAFDKMIGMGQIGGGTEIVDLTRIAKYFHRHQLYIAHKSIYSLPSFYPLINFRDVS